MKINKKTMLTAAVTGVLLAASYTAPLFSANGEAVGECHGVNGCKGSGDCGGVKSNGQKHSCAGQNECKGKGWVALTKSECDKKAGMFKAKN